MQRIAGNNVYGTQPPSRTPANTPGYFGPGVPAAGQGSTQVTYEWANSVQEELISAITVAGISLDVQQHSQLLQAIRNLGGEAVWNSKQNYTPPCLKFGADGKLYIALLSSGPSVADIGPKDPTDSNNKIYWLDYAASITPPSFEKYDLAQYYWFEDEMPRPGLFSCLGGVVQNFSAKYPKAAAYFENEYGKKRLVTQAQYDALHVYSWHTNSDGSKVGWNGIGGVARFVWDKQADTLRLPDLAGMTPEQVGFSDSLGVGGVRGDYTRPVTAGISAGYNADGGFANVNLTGALSATGPSLGSKFLTTISGLGTAYTGQLDTNRVVPTGPRNHGPRWVSSACVYLGPPVL